MVWLFTVLRRNISRLTRASASLRSGTGLASYNVCVPSFYYCCTRAQSPPQIASRPAAYDISFIPSNRASAVKPKFIYLLGADELSQPLSRPTPSSSAKGIMGTSVRPSRTFVCQARRTPKSRLHGSMLRDGRSWDRLRSLLPGLLGRIGRLFGGSPLFTRSNGVSLTGGIQYPGALGSRWRSFTV
jgi:hypothetical protein